MDFGFYCRLLVPFVAKSPIREEVNQPTDEPVNCVSGLTHPSKIHSSGGGKFYALHKKSAVAGCNPAYPSEKGAVYGIEVAVIERQMKSWFNKITIVS